MDFFLILLIILLITAVVDLIVGVSNDAVNFLNSAIGSKVASMRTILIIASIGVLAGSLFSSGMMEIARNGLFNPSFFTFEQVMYIFLAVMLTDVILLDFYNSLGLPTSTTVSLVFEILGAAFVMGLLYSYSKGLVWEEISFGEILNFSSAITIVSGIFLSIFLAFIFGSLTQRISRALFTFNLTNTVRRYGAVFCSLAITTIIYYLLIKGAKGSILISDEQVKWIQLHTWKLIVGCIVFFTILIQLTMLYTKVNPLKVVVLLGTFALAMAFAGNDLVNFIGVAVAGWVSFQSWVASGVPSHGFQMGILAEKVATPAWMLIISGIIMVITLWTNAKSRRVTQTEISLGRQDEGEELFKPNAISRILVGTALLFGRIADSLMPRKWSLAVENRFAQPIADSTKTNASFDLIRATVNLLVSSILIAYGTSQKLPLSTTFITFMVAMGTSFADNAWGRESAVYRVAGVMNVISGWLITAVIAFVFSGLLTAILFKTGSTGVVVLTILAALILIRSHLSFQKEEKLKRQAEANLEHMHSSIPTKMREMVIENLETIDTTFGNSINSVFKESGKTAIRTNKAVRKSLSSNEQMLQKLIKDVRRSPERNPLEINFNIQLLNHLKGLHGSLFKISSTCSDHVENYHTRPSEKSKATLYDLKDGLLEVIKLIVDDIRNNRTVNDVEIARLQEKWRHTINQLFDSHITDIQNGEVKNRLALLYFRIIIETKKIFKTLGTIYGLINDYQRNKL